MDPRYPTFKFMNSEPDCGEDDEGDASEGEAPPGPQSSDNEEEEEEEETEQYLETDERDDLFSRQKMAATLSPDMQQAYRILERLMAPENHVHNWPFQNAVDPSGALWDYAEVVTQPVWFKKVRERLLDGGYTSPTEVFRDLRLMLRNCYRYNGPQHSVTRRGLRLEEMMEQMIAELEPSLRDQCTLEATEGPGALVDPKIISRRRSVRGKTPGYFSHVLHAVRHERADREKEFRRHQLEARRQQRKEKENSIVAWEQRLLSGDAGQRLRASWELPQIAQFIHLSLRAINIFEVPLYELERMLLVPQSSETLAMMMTSLVSSPLIRTKLSELPPMPYHMWTEKLAARVQLWYRAFAKEAGRTERLLETQGIEPAFWSIVGEQNPFETMLFHQLSFYQRIWMVKTLCDYLFHHHKTIQECVMEASVEEPREAVLGRDRHGFEYIHFPHLYVQDVRLYRRRPWAELYSDDVTGSAHVTSLPAIAAPSLKPSELGKWTKAKLEKFRRKLTRMREGGASDAWSASGRCRKSHTCLMAGAVTLAGWDVEYAAEDGELEDHVGASSDEHTDGEGFSPGKSARKRSHKKGARTVAAETPKKKKKKGKARSTPAKTQQPPAPAAVPTDPNVCPYCGMSIRTERARKAHRCFQELQMTSAATTSAASVASNSDEDAADSGDDSDSSIDDVPLKTRSKARSSRGNHKPSYARPGDASRKAFETCSVETPRPAQGRKRGRPKKATRGSSRKTAPPPDPGGESGSERDTNCASSRLSVGGEESRDADASTRGSRASSPSRGGSPIAGNMQKSQACTRSARKVKAEESPPGSARGSCASSPAALTSRQGSPAGSGSSPPPVLEADGLLPDAGDPEPSDDVAEEALSTQTVSSPPPTLTPMKSEQKSADNGPAGDGTSIKDGGRNDGKGSVVERMVKHQCPTAPLEPLGTEAPQNIAVGLGTVKKEETVRETKPMVNGEVSETKANEENIVSENGVSSDGGDRGASGDAIVKDDPDAEAKPKREQEEASDRDDGVIDKVAIGSSAVSKTEPSDETASSRTKNMNSSEKTTEANLANTLEDSYVEMAESKDQLDSSDSTAKSSEGFGSAFIEQDIMEKFTDEPVLEDATRNTQETNNEHMYMETVVKRDATEATTDTKPDPKKVKEDLSSKSSETKIEVEPTDKTDPLSLDHSANNETTPNVTKREPSSPGTKYLAKTDADNKNGSEESSDDGGDNDGPCKELHIPDVISDPHDVPAPDPVQFQLVADSFDELRQLIHTLEPGSSKKPPPCEVELHAALLKILCELEPLETKINQSVRRMRKRLCQEWLNYIERPADYIDPYEEAWRESGDEAEPVSRPAVKSPDPSPQPSEEEDSLDAEGRRKQRSRRAKRKRVNYCVDGVGSQASDPRDRDYEEWQVSSRGRMRKVRKMDDFAYEAESIDENSRSSAASSAQARASVDGDGAGAVGKVKVEAVRADKQAQEGIWEQYRQKMLQRERQATARPPLPSRPAPITEPSPAWNSELNLISENLHDRVQRIRSKVQSSLQHRRATPTPRSAEPAGTAASAMSPGAIRRTVGGPPRPIGQRVVVSKANIVAGALTKVVHTASDASSFVLRMTKEGKMVMAKTADSTTDEDASTSAARETPARPQIDLPDTKGSRFGTIPATYTIKPGTPPRAAPNRVSVVIPCKDPESGATMYMQLPPEQANSILASLNLQGVTPGPPGTATVTTVNAVAVPVCSAAGPSTAPVIAPKAETGTSSQLQPSAKIYVQQPQTNVLPDKETSSQTQASVQLQAQASAESQTQTPVQSQTQTQVQPQTQSTARAQPQQSVLFRHVQSLPIPAGMPVLEQQALPTSTASLPPPPTGGVLSTSDIVAVPANAPPAPVGSQPQAVHLGSTFVPADVATRVKNIIQRAQAENAAMDRQQTQQLAQIVMNDIRGVATSATAPGDVASFGKVPRALASGATSRAVSPRKPQLIRPMPAAVRFGLTPLTPAARTALQAAASHRIGAAPELFGAATATPGQVETACQMAPVSGQIAPTAPGQVMQPAPVAAVHTQAVVVSAPHALFATTRPMLVTSPRKGAASLTSPMVLSTQAQAVSNAQPGQSWNVLSTMVTQGQQVPVTQPPPVMNIQKSKTQAQHGLISRSHQVVVSQPLTGLNTQEFNTTISTMREQVSHQFGGSQSPAVGTAQCQQVLAPHSQSVLGAQSQQVLATQQGVNAHLQQVLGTKPRQVLSTRPQQVVSTYRHQVMIAQPQQILSTHPQRSTSAQSHKTTSTLPQQITNAQAHQAASTPHAAVPKSPAKTLHGIAVTSSSPTQTSPHQAPVSDFDALLASPPSRPTKMRVVGSSSPSGSTTQQTCVVAGRPAVLAGSSQASPQQRAIPTILTGSQHVPVTLTSPLVSHQLTPGSPQLPAGTSPSSQGSPGSPAVRPRGSPARSIPNVQARGVVRPPPMLRAPRYVSTSVQFVSSPPVAATALTSAPGVPASPRPTGSSQQGKIVVIKSGNEQKLGVLMPDGQIMALSDKQVNNVKMEAIKSSRPESESDAAPSQ